MPERKYRLVKVAPGDYILPSNDGNTLWRIRQYEDGPSHGLEDWPRDVIFWGVWKCTLPKALWERLLDPDDWDQWSAWDTGMYNTRQQAIESALKAS